MIRRSPPAVRPLLLRRTFPHTLPHVLAHVLGVAVLCLGAAAPVGAQEEKSPPPAAPAAAPKDSHADADKDSHADKDSRKDAEAAKARPAPDGAARKPSGGEERKLGVRVGAHRDHSRLVFDWTVPVNATLDQNGDRLTIRFNKPARADLSALARSKVPRISQMAQLDDPDGLTLSLTIPANAQVTQSRVDDKVVIDIGDARPAPAPPTPAPAASSAPEKKQDAPAKAAADTRAPPVDPRAAKEGKPLYELRPAPQAPAKTEAGRADGARPEAGMAQNPPAGKPPTGGEAPLAARPMAAVTTVGETPAVKPSLSAAPTPAPEAAGPPAPFIVFNPGAPAAAAIFARSGWLYVLFDHEVPASTVPPRDSIPSLLGAVEPVNFPGGGGFRLPMPAVVEPHASRQGNAWRVTFDRPGLPQAPGVAIVPDTAFALGARLLIKLPASPPVMSFPDPTTGDVLNVVPLPLDGQSVPTPRSYAEIQFPQTAQGVVIRSLDDRLLVQPVREGVEISVPGGLRLSPAEDSVVAAPPEAERKPDRFFDFQKWATVGDGDFTRGRQALMSAIMAMPPEEKTRGWLDMARYYAGKGFGPEALSLLEMVRQQQPDLEKRPEFQAVRGSARILTNKVQDGLADLSSPYLKDEPDVALWQAYGAHRMGDDATAYKLFESRRDLLRSYLEPFGTRFALAAAEAALANHDPAAATVQLDRLTRRGMDKGSAQSAIYYLKGEAQRLAGDDGKAIDFYQKSTEGTDRLYRTKARLALIEEKSKTGKLTPKQTAEEMEKMRFAWTGDALELKILREVADAHVKAGEYPEAFDTMKRALTLYPDSPDAPDISKQMTSTFVNLFVRDEASKMPPLEALSLYEQYKELTPPGPDGDTVIRILAERLVDVDLLDRAAELLDHQVDYRLQGEQKGRVGAREAAIRLLNSQPDQAIAALDKSEVPDQPDDLGEERRLLRARALSKLGRSADAVALLQTDHTRPANLLRIDIAWHAKEWASAAQALADVIGPPPAPGKPLDPAVSNLVVNRAVALSLAQDVAGLQKLRADYGAAMDQGPNADMFKVVTRPQEATGLLDAATIQSQVKEIDLFKGFLDSYRKREKSADAAAGEAAPAATAPTGAAAPPAEAPPASAEKPAEKK